MLAKVSLTAFNDGQLMSLYLNQPEIAKGQWWNLGGSSFFTSVLVCLLVMCACVGWDFACHLSTELIMTLCALKRDF